MARRTALTILLIMLVMASAVTAASAPITFFGLGHVTSIASSKDATGTTTAVAQVDTVMAAVAFDINGKVVKATIDNAQTKVNYDKNMQITSDTTAPQKTKVELEEGYGMARVSSIKLEWFQQIQNFADWMVGKDITEIKALKVKVRDASHTNVPDVPELTSLVTITIQDYIAAVEDAWKNAVEVKPGAVRMGLGQTISIAKSKSATDKAAASAQVDDTMVAALFDNRARVVESIIDTAQTKVAFDTTGKVKSDKTAENKTKKELKEGYGMAAASSLKLEWYQQIENFEAWMVGKKVKDIMTMKLKDNEPDVPELTSMVTVTVQDYIAALVEAYKHAK